MNNKHAIVTGANKGIGLAITKKYLEEGYNVFFCNRKNQSDFDKLFENNILDKKYKNNVINVFFDLGNRETITKAADKIKEYKVKIDVLVNNAGSIDTRLFLMSKIDQIEDFFSENLFSNLIFTQQIAKIFVKQKEGSIVNISSTAGIDGTEGRLAYSTVKSSINMVTKILSKELSYFNIRVNAVAPGLTDTDLMKDSHKKEIIEETVKRQSIKKIASTSDIAELVYYLSSKNSSHITGQVFRIDGGMSV